MFLIREEENGWEVGYFKPNGEWYSLCWEEYYNDARYECNFLNGGIGEDLSKVLDKLDNITHAISSR